MKASFRKYKLNFKQSAGTSRGVLHDKLTYFLKLEDQDRTGIGECALFQGLSADDRPDYEEKLQWLCENIALDKDLLFDELHEFPSLKFGLEQAFLSFQNENHYELFPSEFTLGQSGIPINGLIWMGSKDFMFEQIKVKVDQGFSTLKLKIGAIDFQEEIDLMKYIRKHFSSSDMVLRLDANGAFTTQNALEKLKVLSDFDIHSIEQPIRQNQWQAMAVLCQITPVPIALDEELIGVFDPSKKIELLEVIQPQYIILKPSLIGGFLGSDEWIMEAEKRNIPWWITSALESNVGLNAIAQYTFTKENTLPQGLGTGALYKNNISAPLQVDNGLLWYRDVPAHSIWRNPF